jgi:hypothetical protein
MLPYPLKITSAVINREYHNNDTNTNRSLIKEFVLAGSNDGYTWTYNEGTSALTSTYSAINVSIAEIQTIIII